jgi:hypothetical protein
MTARAATALACLALAACGGGGSSRNDAPRVTGVSAIAADGEVTISWSPVAGATAYNLYWDVSPGVRKEVADVIEDVTSPERLPIQNGVTYYVVLTAVTAGGETAESAEVSFTAGDGGNGADPVDGPPGTVTTLAGGNGMAYADGGFVDAGFHTPTGIATDGTHLYVSDYVNGTIRKLDLTMRQVSTVAGRGWGASADGTATGAAIATPTGIVATSTALYVADAGAHAIRRVDLATGAVTTIAGALGVPGRSDGVGAAARFDTPIGLALDGTSLYVADSENHAIRVVDLATSAVTTLAGDPTDYAGFADGAGASARFMQPFAIALVGTTLFVADRGNSAIRRVEVDTGLVDTVSQTPSLPQALAVVGTTLYYVNGALGGGHPVLPGQGNTITAMDLITGDEWLVAGGNWDAQLADGTGTDAALNYPEGLVALGGELYVADTLNHAIRVVTFR